MGNFVAVYTDELNHLETVIGSRDESKLAEVLKLGKALIDGPAEAAVIKSLIDGGYTTEVDDGSVIKAFQVICSVYAKTACIIEIYIDDETFPEMFEFVCGNENDPFDLPTSEFGTPVCSHYDSLQTVEYLTKFTDLNGPVLLERTGNDCTEELTELIDVLQAAKIAKQGVFVFFSE